jgi:DNA-binding transcriptional ArsR family regulator
MKKGEWTFFSNHGTVLAYISKHSMATAQEIAQEAGLSIRAVQNIITALEKAGYIARQREGRRNRYTVHPDRPMRHRLQRGYTVGNVLMAIGYNPEKTIVKQQGAPIKRLEAEANTMK